jgi:hypothetical protein
MPVNPTRGVIKKWIKALRTAKPARAQAWMPTEERTPEDGVCVLGCIIGRQEPVVAKFIREINDGGGWIMFNQTLKKEYITHWHPLPAPPEVKT